MTDDATISINHKTCSYAKWKKLKKKAVETSLVLQWLRFPDPKAGGPGSVLGQGTGSWMPHLRVHVPQGR